MSLAQLTDHLKGKVVIIGVGNLLKGDDGFGPHMVRNLQGSVKATLFDCGSVPENYLGPIRHQRPDTVLVLDTADFSANPGSLEVFDSSRWAGGGLSSHSISLGLFSDLLIRETGARVYLVAIQPKQLQLGQSMSAEVKEGCRRLQRFLVKALSQNC
jgi:hydrogenase 3 maturation protease